MNRQVMMIAALLAILVVAPAPGAFADGKVGVVLMHGKDSTAKAKSPIGKLANYLDGDFEVEAPDMPWSRSNGINKTLEESFKDIDAIVADLKSDGATKIVVGGHSMGAAAALAYATQRPGLAGVLMIAPGHRPDRQGRKNAAALDKAKALIAAGNPEDDVDIQDINQGRSISRTLDADIAVSWFDPDGLAVMQNAAAKLPEGTPVLFIIGEKDRLRATGESLIFSKLPAHSNSAYTVVPGGHRVTPMKGKSEIADWLRRL